MAQTDSVVPRCYECSGCSSETHDATEYEELVAFVVLVSGETNIWCVAAVGHHLGAIFAFCAVFGFE